jgi:SAM-dependent methyltransferase
VASPGLVPRRYLADVARSLLPRPLLRIAARCARAMDTAQARAFDLVMGVSTAGAVVTKESIFISGGEFTSYTGCQWLALNRALRDLQIGPTDVFLDLGSGKGKSLLIAGRFPCKRVIGVELNEELCAHARSNIESARTRMRAGEISSINANVLDWPVPSDASVIFMYNPFIGETTHRVAEGIIKSYDLSPRNLHLLYAYPWEHDWIMRTGRFVVEDVRPLFWPTQPGWWRSGQVMVTYRVVSEDRPVTGGTPDSRQVFRRRQALQRWSTPNKESYMMRPRGYQVVESRQLKRDT